MPEFMMRGPRTPCADDPDLHNHGKHGEAGAELDRWAKQVCRPCPFRAQCKQWAIDNDQRGVWGGTTYRERIASL
jgi:WhiB family redox-sensing transcriptional regulator